jgi:hypothetical protein
MSVRLEDKDGAERWWKPSSVMDKIQHLIAQGCSWGSCMLYKKKCVAMKL